ncbi:hypothetical protein TNCV_2548631 [Trichonephila clavipes]|nr:hypothetical protein TNCV_2548631 [Trichonephila clavipes]
MSQLQDNSCHQCKSIIYFFSVHSTTEGSCVVDGQLRKRYVEKDDVNLRQMSQHGCSESDIVLGENTRQAF